MGLAPLGKVWITPAGRALKLIFNFILYPLKKIFGFFLLLFSSDSSVQSENLSLSRPLRSNYKQFDRKAVAADENLRLNQKGTNPKFRISFSSLFNKINNWYERSSPFSYKPATTSSSAIGGFNMVNQSTSLESYQ